MKSAPRLLALLFTLLLELPAPAQVPDTLVQSIPAPFGEAQKNSQLGFNVAVDGDYIVASAPNDYSVKVFNSTTGAPVLDLGGSDLLGNNLNFFGDNRISVAISGSLVAMGAIGEITAGFTSSGRVYVFDLNSATPETPVFTVDNPTPAQDDYFGQSVAISGSYLVVGAEGDDTAALNAGNVYVYDLASATPTIPLGTLSNPSTAAFNGFGKTLAMSGTRVVAKDTLNVYVYDLGNGVTALPMATLSGDGPVAISGASVVVGDYGGVSVKVFDTGSATPAIPVAMLTNPGTSSLSFGLSVAVSGTRIVVGDYHFYPGGRAFVFDLSSVTPAIPVATLDNPTPARNDWFGWSVAVSGARVVVGTPRDSTVQTEAGSAYLYDLDGAAPTVPAATLLHPSPSFFDHFGRPLAMSGTLMVVGVPSVVFGLGSSGTVYIYDLAAPDPAVPVLTLHNPNPEAFSYFGSAVAISGTRVVIGAPYDYTVAGRAYLYDVGGPTPTVPVATLASPNPVQNERFGASVAISGTWVSVGDSPEEPNSRGVFVFNADSATPAVPVLKLTSPSQTQSDGFGDALAAAGATLVVGAPYDDTGATDAGRTYIYNLVGATPTVPTLILDNPAPAPNDLFGITLAISGTRIVIGAYYDDAGAPDAGSAYVYDLASATPSLPVVTLPNPSPGADELFGSSVGISGARVVVGAMYDRLDAPKAGSAFVYDLGSANPAVPVATLRNPTPENDDEFGAAVAIDGVTVVVGAPGDSAIAFKKGYAYVFGPNPKDQDSDGLLDSWEMAHFGSTAGHAAADDDEGDGVGNLLEEAFDTDPLSSDALAIPAVVNEDGYLTITIAKHPGVNYEVQTAATPDPVAFSAATTTVLVNTVTTLKVCDNFPIGTTPARYLRVKVTAAP